MGYALFAQRKVCLTSMINSVSLQQTQRSNEQNTLATNTLSLQQQLSSMQSAQALELSGLYEMLANVGEDGLDAEFKKEVEENSDEYSKYVVEMVGKDGVTRDQINAKIEQIKAEQEAELDDINRQIYMVGVKENAIEMEIKRLDTRLTSLEKLLEEVKEAEGDAIKRATPSFKGVG